MFLQMPHVEKSTNSQTLLPTAIHLSNNSHSIPLKHVIINDDELMMVVVVVTAWHPCMALTISFKKPKPNT